MSFQIEKDWNRPSQAFRRFDGSPVEVPPRVTTPDHRAASIEAWRSAPAVRREYERGLRNGWIGAMAFYGLLSTVLVLAFHVLGVRP